MISSAWVICGLHPFNKERALGFLPRVPPGTKQHEVRRTRMPTISGKILTSFDMEKEIMSWIVQRESEKHGLSESEIKERRLLLIREKFKTDLRERITKEEIMANMRYEIEERRLLAISLKEGKVTPESILDEVDGSSLGLPPTPITITFPEKPPTESSTKPTAAAIGLITEENGKPPVSSSVTQKMTRPAEVGRWGGNPWVVGGGLGDEARVEKKEPESGKGAGRGEGRGDSGRSAGGGGEGMISSISSADATKAPEVSTPGRGGEGMISSIPSPDNLPAPTSSSSSSSLYKSNHQRKNRNKPYSPTSDATIDENNKETSSSTNLRRCSSRIPYHKYREDYLTLSDFESDE